MWPRWDGCQWPIGGAQGEREDAIQFIPLTKVYESEVIVEGSEAGPLLTLCPKNE